MITIIHGDDTTASRNYLQDIREKSKELITLHGPTLDVTSLTQILTGGDMFGSRKTVIIEELLQGKKGSQEESLIPVLMSQSGENTIYLWEKKILTSKTLAKLPGAKNMVFSLPKTLFQLLDSLAPGNTKAMMKLFHKTLTTTEAELIFFMIVRQFRILLAISAEGNPIDEVKRLTGWQQSRLSAQAKRFTVHKLIRIYRDLLTIDREQKTGKATMPLSQSIDFFLLSL